MTQQNPFAAPQGEADEFEIMRQRLRQRGAARGEQAQRQARRDIAALGNLPSGAALKQRQLAAQQAEELTGREVQDVNILQAQTQRAERESEAQRGIQSRGQDIQRFGITEQSRLGERGQDIQKLGITEQSRIAARGQDIQRFGITEQSRLAQSGQDIQRFGIEEQSRVSLAGQAVQQSIAEKGFATDLQKTELQNAGALDQLRLQGANALELQEAKADFDREAQRVQILADEKAAFFVERGMDRRLATTIASNKELQQMADNMAQQGIDIQNRLADITEDTAQQESILNQAATVINSFDPLRSLGFNQSEIGDMLTALDLPFADDLMDLLGIEGGLQEPGSIEEQRAKEEETKRLIEEDRQRQLLAEGADGPA